MHQETETPIRFSSFTLDLVRGRLFGDEGDVPLRPKSFAFLSHMARNAGRVVSKDELLSAIWPEVIVTEDSLTRCVHEVRKALGPTGPAVLRTVPRRGYLFERLMVEQTAGQRQPAQSTDANPAGVDAFIADSGARLRRDGIAVLPFTLPSPAAPSDTLLLDGLVHDVISRLARLRSFHVIARGSTFALRHLAPDPRLAGAELGVAYVVVGTARVENDNVRLQVDLVDSSDGRIVWTDEIAGIRAAHAVLLDDLSDRLTQAISREITIAERNRALLVPHQVLDSWQSYHCGLFHMLQFTIEQSLRARAFFDQAIHLDAGFARAHAGVSYCYFLEAFLRPRDARHTEIDLAFRSASRAIELDEQNPSSRWAYGRALWLMGDEDGGLTHLQTAVDLSPSFAMGYQTLAFMLAQSGSPKEAIRHAETAVALSPHDPFLCAIYGSHAMALVRLGEVEEAASMGLKAARQHNVHKHILGITAISLALAGREHEAREQVSRIRLLDENYALPDFTSAFMRLSDDALVMVRKAGSQIGLT